MSGQFLFLYEIGYKLQSEGLGSARRLFRARPDLREHLRATMAMRDLCRDHKEENKARAKRSGATVLKGEKRRALEPPCRGAQKDQLGILSFGKPTLRHGGTGVVFYARDRSSRLVCIVSKEALRSAYELDDNPLSFMAAFREHYLDIQRRVAIKYARELGERPRTLELTAQDLLAKR